MAETTEKPKRGRGRPRKQPELPAMKGAGVERPEFTDVDTAADVYVATRDKRMELTKKEVEAKAELLAAMKGHDLVEYEYEHDGETRLVKVVKPSQEDDVKVKTLPSREQGEFSSDVEVEDKE